MTTLGDIASGLRLHLRYAIFLAIILGVALFRPWFGERKVEIEANAGNIVVAMDVSISMLARDATPTRLEAAKRKLRDLAHYATTLPGARLAIVLFGGSAFKYCPLTSDLKVIETYIQAIAPGLIADKGSLLNEAITESVAALGGKPGSIIIFSDGEDGDFDLPSAERALPDTVNVSAIGFGTPEGSPIQVAGGQLIRDASGEVVVSKRDDVLLNEITDEMGGSYIPAQINDSDIKKLLDSVSSQSSLLNVTQKNEYGFVALMIAAALLMFGAYKNFILVLALFILSPTEARAQTSDAYEGSRKYQEGDFASALKEFGAALQKEPNNLDLLQGLGSSQFKTGDFEGAKGSFSRLEQGAKSDRHRFDGAYDLGNTLLATREYASAIEAYDRALAIQPGEKRATTNREIARRRMEEEKQEQNQTQEQEQNQGQKQEQNREQNADEQKRSEQEQQSEQQSERQGEDSKKEQSTQQKLTEEQASGEENAKEERQKEMQDSAAQRWLDSLPDSPVLLRRKNATNESKTEQTW